MSQMHAVVCESFGPIDDLSITSLPIPEPKPNEVLIKVAACGVNFPDALLVQGLYQLKPECPFIPGTEVSGVVTAIGENVQGILIGQSVIGMCMLGGYAEYVTCASTHVIPIPEAMPLPQAAGLMTAYATAHHGLKQRGQLEAGQTVLVTGAAGGTGLAAVTIAKLMGATVIAACSSDDKCALTKTYGADHTINYSEHGLKDAVKDITNGQGVDVVYECVGGDIFNASVSCLAFNGRLLVIGFASGDIPKFAVNLALVKGISIVGVFWGTFTQKQPALFAQNMQELMAWVATGQLEVHVEHQLPLTEFVEALTLLGTRKAKGKIVLLPQ